MAGLGGKTGAGGDLFMIDSRMVLDVVKGMQHGLLGQSGKRW